MKLEIADDHVFQIPIEEIRLIARSAQLPGDDREFSSLGEYIDAYESRLATDYALYIQARTKARAYIALRLITRIRWNSGRDGAIARMTAELRDQLLNAVGCGQHSTLLECK